ncbi:hypothetical protein CFK37_00085 [Virgibacillus phasianinus]|uniref:Uncharacterized protein n=1 Tax=Virgibacillus phasianinus TaxID=2017483 RepID=A0A220TXY8_9BACI|nr:DUF6157 family protein [Virgibacillus phasianinus]ASK60718.1 hypothetical protein CFK37_00085 [Virgibacillus phasianinus]
MSYKNTFIKVSEDSTADPAIVPVPRNEKPTIASIEYELIKNNPYQYTQDDVQFKTHSIRNQIEDTDEQREQFFAKPKACFRASPLVKKYGWGIHYNAEGKVSIYGVESEAYQDYLNSEGVTVLNGMRSKRKNKS